MGRADPLLRWFSAAVVIAVVVQAGCAECSVDDECGLGQVCTEDGRCEIAEGASVEVEDVGDGVVGERFQLVVAARFRGALATVRVDRDVSQPGDPCLPFPPVEVLVEGDRARETTQRVVLRDLPALGAAFALRVSLDAPSGSRATSVALRGPPATGTGGAILTSPQEAPLDVLTTPLWPLHAEVAGPTVAWVEPASAPPSARVVVADHAGPVDALIPLARGPQTVWLETTLPDGETVHCGRGVLGTPAGDDDGRLEIALIATSPEDAWVTLSLRVRDADDEQVCTRESDNVACERARIAVRAGTLVVEATRVALGTGTVDIAAVPALTVGPVDGLVRITRAGRHVDWLGPFTFAPDEGASWIAGHVVLEAGQVRAVVADHEIVLGAPW